MSISTSKLAIHPRLVTVVIPSFNHVRFIGQCIDSVLDQNYRDIEVFVIDDGSSDRTVELLKTYGNRITLIEQIKGKQGRARNLALAKACGEYVAFVDSDDHYLPGRIGRAVEILAANPDVDVVWSDYIEIDSDGKPVSQFSWQPKMSDFRHELISGNMICNATATVRRAVLDRIGHFDVDSPRTCDAIAWYKIAASGGQFRHIPEPLVAYRKHGANDSNAFVAMTKERDKALQIGLSAYQANGVVASRSEWLFIRNGLVRQFSFHAAAAAQLQVSSTLIGWAKSKALHILGSTTFLALFGQIQRLKKSVQQLRG